MAVSLDDVRHIAGLARLGLTDERAHALVAELNTILGHMDVLSRVDTSQAASAQAGVGMPLRDDAGPADPLDRGPQAFAPSVRDGFFLVPRLATHETGEES
ncbi:MAG: Asp-tRNA(Asn)/Glu-tRNA(Gln) amidotransferase subunit GatC [Gemmatimonadaceae bacterium]